jgi:ABC-2 type transport system permease protein
MEKLTNFYLYILDLFSGLFVRLGVDYAQLRAIVGVKLTMDQRRARTRFNGTDEQSGRWGYVWSLVITLLFSSLLALVITLSPSVLAAYSIVAAYSMLIIVMTLITDFSQVILDGSDNAIILPRPVSSRTLVSARMVHAVIYLTQLALASLLPATIITFNTYGIVAGLTLFLLSGLIALLSVVFTMLLYLVLMQFATEEKLRNIINGIQIVSVIMIMVGYQAVLRVFDLESLLQSAVVEWAWWHLLLPPMWIGYIFQGLIGGVLDGPVWMSIALLIGVPSLSFRLLNSSLAARFSSNLSGIDTVSTDKMPGASVRRSLSEWLSRWVMSTPTERGIFEIVWKISARDRKFKLRTYPSLAYFVVIVPILFVHRTEDGLSEMLAEIERSEWRKIVMIYYCALILSVVNKNLTFLDQYKAAWVYYVTPVAQPGEILMGSLWACILRFFVPALILIGILLFAIWGVESLDDLILGTTLMIIFEQLLILATPNQLPFSREYTTSDGGQFVRIMGLLMLMFLMGFGHWAASQLPYVIMGIIPFALLLLIFLNREIRKLGWEKVQQ